MNQLGNYNIVERLSECNTNVPCFESFIIDRAYALLWNLLGYSVESFRKQKLIMKAGSTPYFGNSKAEADYLNSMVHWDCASLYYLDYMIVSKVWNFDEISLNVTYEDAYLSGVEEGWAEPGHEYDWSAQCSQIMRYMENHAIDFLEDNLFPIAGDLEEFDAFLTAYPDAVTLISRNMCDVDIEGTYTTGYLFRSTSWSVMKELYDSRKLSSKDKRQVKWFWAWSRCISLQSISCVDYMYDVQKGVFLFIHSDKGYSPPKLVMEPYVMLYFVYGDKLAAYLKEKYLKKGGNLNGMEEH